MILVLTLSSKFGILTKETSMGVQFAFILFEHFLETARCLSPPSPLTNKWTWWRLVLLTDPSYCIAVHSCFQMLQRVTKLSFVTSRWFEPGSTQQTKIPPAGIEHDIGAFFTDHAEDFPALCRYIFCRPHVYHSFERQRNFGAAGFCGMFDRLLCLCWR